jgi:hypothetical protein
MTRRTSFACCLVVAAIVWVANGPTLIAHDLPTDVLVQTFVKPEAERLRVMVRVPLVAMGDVDYPTRGPAGLMDLARIDRALADAASLWIVPSLVVYENERPLGQPRLAAARVSLPSDRSFATYEDAIAHVTGTRIPSEVDLYWNQAMLDVLLEFDIADSASDFSVQTAFARLGVHVGTTLRFIAPSGAVRAFQFRGDPGRVRLDPRWHQAAWRFVRLGFEHILSGTDHLLFLIGLVIPLRRLRSLIPVVTAFAVAHSLTLVAAALGVAPSSLWFPPLVETLIAASIVYMAIENMLSPAFRHRWVVAFLFGLVHGFGFSFALGESLQFAGTHLVTSLLSFNLGVEAGQLLVLAVLIPPLNFLFRHARSERVGVVVLSAVVAHTAWHWMVERGSDLQQYRFDWPVMDAALAARISEWLLLAAIAAGTLWAFGRVQRRFIAS